jgi:hypothetical protein
LIVCVQTTTAIFSVAGAADDDDSLSLIPGKAIIMDLALGAKKGNCALGRMQASHGNT